MYKGKSMRKKTRTKKDKHIEELNEILTNDTAARREGGKKKSWSQHDLRDIKPMTEAQRMMIHSYMEGSHIVAHGYAGTGKSLIALFLGINDILSKDSKRKQIKIIRSIVPARDVGFLPGTYEEKMAPYETPYQDIVGFLMGKDRSYDFMKEAGYIQFIPTSLIRGLTWDDSVIIIDEMQNFTIQEISSAITRTGTNSRIIAIGDYQQNDLYRSKYDTSGIQQFLKIAARMKEFDIINFRKEDIVRADIVKSWLIAMEETS